MKREWKELQARTHDVLIVGGGIYGAALAREAATRGLKTALVEQADFCSGSSANSLKIVHGGLRYLQQADLPRVFESVRERSILLRTAPHLASPVPCLMPTRGLGMKSRPVMAMGMLVNDILSCHRNRHLDPLRKIPNGGTLSRSACLEILPMLRDSGATGAARWYDGLAYDTERLAIGMLKAAARAGAALANYVQVRGLIVEKDRVVGATVADQLSGATLDIRADLVINAAGPWIEQLLAGLGRPQAEKPQYLALAMNLVLQNWPVASHALGLQSTLKRRLYFFMPWRGAVMAGTYYREFKGSPDGLRVTDEDISSYLEAINSCLPGASISRKDILAVQAGIVPSLRPAHPDREPDLLRHYQLLDHAKRDGIEGLMSVVGIKFTTARGVAEKVIDAVATKTGKTVAPSSTHRDPLPGGDMPDLARFRSNMAAAHPDVPAKDLERLLSLYGTEAKDVFALAAALTGPDALLRAELLFALREEMPQTLGDLVFRRTGLASAGSPPVAVLRLCAETMGAERGWSTERIRSEMVAVEKAPNLWQAGCLPTGGAA
jgi:glycerol-3-phosphate dehydrogenase